MGDFKGRLSVLEGQQPARIYTAAEVDDLLHWAKVGQIAVAVVLTSSAVYIIMTLLGAL